MHQCAGITDLSPLADCKSLRLVVVPPNAKNFEFFATLPGLERIRYKDDPKNSWRYPTGPRRSSGRSTTRTPGSPDCATRACGPEDARPPGVRRVGGGAE